MLTTIVFGAIFFGVLGALASFVLTENKLQMNTTSGNRGLAIAEAGLEYYRWFLAHNPNDLQNGTGVPRTYTIAYDDPEGGQTGTITLTVPNPHEKEVSQDLLMRLLRQSGISREQWMRQK